MTNSFSDFAIHKLNDGIKGLVSQQIIPKQFTLDAVSDLVELLLDIRSSSLSGQVLHVGGV